MDVGNNEVGGGFGHIIATATHLLLALALAFSSLTHAYLYLTVDFRCERYRCDEMNPKTFLRIHE